MYIIIISHLVVSFPFPFLLSSVYKDAKKNGEKKATHSVFTGNNLINSTSCSHWTIMHLVT